MARESIICGLDIGTSNIRLVIAQIAAGQEKPQVLGVAAVPSFGLRKGVVVDVEETVKGIKKAVEEVERSTGIHVGRALINVGGNHISCRTSQGVVAVSRADGEISREDVDRAVKAAQAVSIPQNRELIHTIPRFFAVDEEKFIKDPVGMSGVRLEADAILIEGATPFIKNLTKCLNEANLDIDDMVLGSLASAKAILSKRQKELGVLVLDFGGGTTGMTVFEEGDILHACVLPIGGSHITNDIAIGLRTSVDVAEKVKIEYGTALPDEINKKDMIDLTKIEGEEGVYSRKYVAEIMSARLQEIFDLVNKELKKIDRQGLLPAGIVIVGGGAKIPGIVDLAKDELKLPSQIGFPAGVDGILSRIDDPTFATAVGLMLWGAEGHEKIPAGISLPKMDFLEGIKKWFKGFIP